MSTQKSTTMEKVGNGISILVTISVGIAISTVVLAGAAWLAMKILGIDI